MDTALFDDPLPSLTPPHAGVTPGETGGAMEPEGPSLTKSISENENRLLQAVSNKYGIGAISATLAVIILLSLSPPFVTDEDGKFSMQLILALSFVVFLAVVWGPAIWTWIYTTWIKDRKLNLSPANAV